MARLTVPQAAELHPDAALALLIGPTEGWSPTEDELRPLWPYHRERLMGHPHISATRPWGWWAFEAGMRRRPQDRLEEVRLLAAGGHPTAEEIADLRKRAAEAQPRIDTEAEQGTMIGGGRWNPKSGDRLTVAVGEALDAGLAELSGAG